MKCFLPWTQYPQWADVISIGHASLQKIIYLSLSLSLSLSLLFTLSLSLSFSLSLSPRLSWIISLKSLSYRGAPLLIWQSLDPSCHLHHLLRHQHWRCCWNSCCCCCSGSGDGTRCRIFLIDSHNCRKIASDQVAYWCQQRQRRRRQRQWQRRLFKQFCNH